MQTEFSDVVEAQPQRTAVAAAATAAVDLRKVDLTAVALARFGDWRADVAKSEAILKDIAWDLKTAKGLAEIKSMRNLHCKVPRADANKIADALVTKLADVSRSVRGEQALAVKAFDELAAPLTELIDARQAELDEEARIEAERKAAHEAAIVTIAGYVDMARDKCAADIAKGIAYVQGLVIDPAAWQEYAARAEATRADVLAKLQALHQQAADREAAAARLEAQRVENERVARDLAEQKAALDAQAAALRQQQEEQQRQAAAAETALVSSIRAESRRVEWPNNPQYISKAMTAFEGMARDWENDPRPTVHEAIAEGRAYLAGLMTEAQQRPTEPAAPAVTAAAFLAVDPGPAAPAIENTEVQPTQQVLKAEPTTADATDRVLVVTESPRSGAMGAGQAAAAAPVAGFTPPPFGGVDPKFCPGSSPDCPQEFPEQRFPNEAPAAELATEPTHAAFVAKVMEAFASRFPSQPRMPVTWWAEVRAMGEALQAQATA